MRLQHTAYHTARRLIEAVEDQWFDRTRRVRTAGDVPLLRAGIPPQDIRDSELYVPARPRHVRAALRDAQQTASMLDPSRYTYIDLGSGKGRTLFVAAELPFRDIVGVEFSLALHQQAQANIGSFRNPHARTLHALHQNATHFVFPDGPLVLYLFNPFGRDTMQFVLSNLEHSLNRHPRHTVVILLWPRCGDLVARLPGMQEVCITPHHQIFHAHA